MDCSKGMSGLSTAEGVCGSLRLSGGLYSLCSTHAHAKRGNGL